MTAIVKKRRRRTLLMLLAAVLVLGAVPALGWYGGRAVLDSRGGKDVAVHALPVVPFPKTPTGMLLTAEGKRLTSITVFVVDPSGAGGSIVSVPVNADIGFADNKRKSLQQVFKKSGLDATKDAISSVLPVSIDFTAVYDTGMVDSFVAPLEKVNVNLPQAVAPSAAGKNDGMPAGKATLDPTGVARVLLSGPEDFKREDTRRPNLEALWAGVTGAIGDGKPAAAFDKSAVPASFEDVAAHVFAGPTHSRGLSAITLTLAQNPNSIDTEELDRSEAVFVFAAVAPGEMSPTAPGPTFRLVAPPGFDAGVKRTIDKLLFFGGNVVSVDTTAPPQAGTVFYVPDDVLRQSAASTNGIFGTFTFGTPTERIEGVDLTVVLGTDYLKTAATS